MVPDCVSDDRLAAFAAGRLDDGDIEAVEAHIDVCEACRQTVVLLRRGELDSTQISPSPGKTATGATPELPASRYHLIAPIGRGGMGMVYRAVDPQLKREIALKVVSFAHIGAERKQVATERLLREAEALAMLSHENIVTVYDVGRLGEDVFIAMELIVGQTLRQWLKGKRTHTEIISMFSAAGRGVAAAHAQGIVHRDFKPDNVMIADSGLVKVLDFGLARIDDASDAGAQPVAPGARDTVLLGTPRYMSPEQLERRPTDARTDQYSFCLSLYEAFFRRRATARAGTAEAARVAGPATGSARSVARRTRARPGRSIQLDEWSLERAVATAASAALGRPDGRNPRDRGRAGRVLAAHPARSPLRQRRYKTRRRVGRQKPGPPAGRLWTEWSARSVYPPLPSASTISQDSGCSPIEMRVARPTSCASNLRRRLRSAASVYAGDWPSSSAPSMISPTRRTPTGPMKSPGKPPFSNHQPVA